MTGSSVRALCHSGFHLGKSWVAHRSRIAEPDGERPLYGYYLPAWWDSSPRHNKPLNRPDVARKAIR
jgi:hypothetical protein